jgi:hypothetical protein
VHRCPPPPPNQRAGVKHSPTCEGVGESQFGRLEESLVLCLLCVLVRIIDSQIFCHDAEFVS